MSVRVIARMRPLLKSETEKDIIITTASAEIEPESQPTVVRIPNPKNECETFSFQFNSVYDQDASQQDIFDNEGNSNCLPMLIVAKTQTLTRFQYHQQSNTSSMVSMLHFLHMESPELERRTPCVAVNRWLTAA